LVIQASGAHTRRIQEIADSDEARALLHGAYGRMVIEPPERKKQLWLAGGIGVTPFLSMCKEMAAYPDRYKGYDVSLILVVHTAEHAFKLPELQQCELSHPGLHVHVWDGDRRGRLTVDAIADEFAGDLRDRAVMISGPEPMIAHLTRDVLAAGVTRGQIRSERAIGPPGGWDVASPALRYTRAVVTAFFALFVVAVVVSTLARAIFA
jgi:predicted ferric reductase